MLGLGESGYHFSRYTMVLYEIVGYTVGDTISRTKNQTQPMRRHLRTHRPQTSFPQRDPLSP